MVVPSLSVVGSGILFSMATQLGYVGHYQGPRTQDLTTPRQFFDRLNEKHRFTMDGAATSDNALLPCYSSEAFPRSWQGERVFCNPPWSNIRPFVELAPTAEFACLLVPARTNYLWFHRALELGARVEFFKSRLRFGSERYNSPVDCLLLIFDRSVAHSGACLNTL